VNGDPLQLPGGATVADLVARWCRSELGIAVAIERVVVPRSRWTVTEVPQGAHVEIVEAAAGG
jgi:sulfur carrier protein